MVHTSDDVVLRVEDIHTYFYQDGRVNRALTGVSFELRRGRVLGVVGESGCGKSVTASSIMQLLPPLARIESGRINYFQNGTAVDISSLARGSKAMRAIRGEQISMIFQDPMVSLNPVYTIGWQIVEMLRLHRNLTKKAAKERAIELLAQMGIPSPAQRFNEYPHQFSGGMRQRAMIAMAMSCEPRVLIADEPTTALDVTVQAQIFELIKDLSDREGMATMLITHDMGVIAELADDVAVMYMGRIVESGSTRDVLNNPQHPYTRALISSIPILGKGRNQDLDAIPGFTPDPYNRPPGCQFAPRCPIARDICATRPPTVHVSSGHAIECWKEEFDEFVDA